MEHDKEEALAEYPQEVIELINDQKYFGRMNDPLRLLTGRASAVMRWSFIYLSIKIRSPR